MAIYNPTTINTTGDPANVFLNMQLTNNDAGAIYNSATLNTLSGLDDALWALPENQSNYASKADMLGDWSIAVRSPPTGEVSTKWFSNTNNDGTIDLFHQGIGYDQWTSNANSDMMALTVSIPKSQLEVDGQAGYSPLSGDAQIVLGDQRQDAYVALNISGATIDAPGQNYDIQIVPEPSAACIGLGLLAAAVLCRRRR